MVWKSLRHSSLWKTPLFVVGKTQKHGNGIALIFARTETRCFFENVWYSADGLLFVKGRIRFYHVTGELGGSPGAPSVFVAYGKENAKALKKSGIEGKYLEL